MIETDVIDLKLQILKNLELFSELNDEDLLELANISVLCTVEKGKSTLRLSSLALF